MASSDTEKSLEEKKKIYECMKKYIVPSYSLGGKGFPTMDSNGRVTVQKVDRNAIPTLPNRNERLCHRCRKKFTINADGTFTPAEKCVYHNGGIWNRKRKCCGKNDSSIGCETAVSHVHRENRFLDLEGYVKTSSTPHSATPTYDVYCVDCEMIYTSHGLELAHVTVVDTELKTVVDELVKPTHRVVDWNTRFSGITADMMKNVTTTLPDIQTKLLELFDDKTILVAHSPEFDFAALKLIHINVVDTCEVFTVTKYKKPLKDIVKENLGRIIQADRGLGHDSKEDAIACMEVMMWKVKKDLGCSAGVVRKSLPDAEVSPKRVKLA